MNIPDKKKERIIFFSLIGVVGAVVIYVAITWGLLPLLESKKTLESTLTDRQEKLKKARRELDYALGIQRDYDEVMAKIGKINNDNIFRPILGSYLVGVSEQIEAAARATGVKVEDTREVGVVDIPLKAKDSSLKAYKAFAVQVGGYGSYQAITRFILQMEERNPFFSVTDMTISGQPDNPEQQRLSVRMEWPIENLLETKRGGG
ncbi:MAG: hypothetical protein WCO42_03070 [bacterium]